MPRIATLESTISIKINTGNFESLDVTKSVKTDVEYADPEDLKKKQEGFDKSVIDATKAEAERTMEATGRKRKLKAERGQVEKELPLWGE